jgi:hypothetical protein
MNFRPSRSKVVYVASIPSWMEFPIHRFVLERLDQRHDLPRPKTLPAVDLPIPPARQQTGDGNVLVDVRPMQPKPADLDRLALSTTGLEQTEEPRIRDADCPSVRQFHPHRIVAEPNGLGRNRHGLSPSSCPSVLAGLVPAIHAAPLPLGPSLTD